MLRHMDTHPVGGSGLGAVLHEDQELLVVNKPAGLVCHPSKQGPLSSLIGRVRAHLGEDARPHLVNRLDRETSGLILIAKTDAAARELRRLWERQAVAKEYLAIVQGHPAADTGTVDAPLGRDEHSPVAIRDRVRADGSPARTDYVVLNRFRRQEEPGAGRDFALLQVRPHTGRKHQIRIHLAHLGHPIVGDKIYGGDGSAYLALVEGRLTPAQQAELLLPHQALHARALRFAWRGRGMAFCCEPEAWFAGFIGT